MALESHLNKERINVKKLTLEEPERKPELPFDPEKEIREEAWQGMKNELEEYRNDDSWEHFFTQAMEMKILAAEEVKVTNKGLEIIMSKREKSYKQKTPPIPKTRKF